MSAQPTTAEAARTLLERLDRPETSGNGTEAALLASIRTNLHRLLNARRGSAPAAPDYGLPELIEPSFGRSALVRIEDEIRRAVEAYEPRLRRIEVRFRPGGERLSLTFEIRGEIEFDGLARAARFETLLGGFGEIAVRSAEGSL